MSDTLWGAAAIARAAGVVDEDGEADLRRVFYLLEKGYLPARKVGRAWISSRSAIQRALEIEAA
jgi:hypothetical protein